MMIKKMRSIGYNVLKKLYIWEKPKVYTYLTIYENCISNLNFKKYGCTKYRKKCRCVMASA